jgi:hypothetical protein
MYTNRYIHEVCSKCQIIASTADRTESLRIITDPKFKCDDCTYLDEFILYEYLNTPVTKWVCMKRHYKDIYTIFEKQCLIVGKLSTSQTINFYEFRNPLDAGTKFQTIVNDAKKEKII